MKKKILPDIEIVELILVRCGFDFKRTFIGTIKRGYDSERNQILSGSVVINEGMIYSCSSNENELYQYLDEICLMKMDYNLHSDAGVVTKILDCDFFLN